MSVAMASPQHWWLGWVTLLPLFSAIRWLPLSRAYLGGAVWGASLFGFSLLNEGSAINADLPTFLALTTVPAFYAGFGASLTRSIGFSPYLLALGWVGMELTLFPLGLRHGLLATTQDGGVALQVVGSFTGYLIIAFLVAYVNALLFTVLSTVKVGGGGLRRAPASSLSPKSIVPIDVPAYLSYLLRPSHPRAPPVLG
jgi:apolipoprotein N-acyltransferase